MNEQRKVSEHTRLKQEQRHLRKRMAKAQATLKLRQRVQDFRIEVLRAEGFVEGKF